VTDAGPAADAAERWREEIARTARRLANLAALAAEPEPRAVGATPRERVAVWRRARLYRYASPRTLPTPVLFVPNLGISRPYIFDLMPGASFVEHMTGAGFDFYLLDWGVFRPTDRRPDLTECVLATLPRMVDAVLERSGARQLSLLGYCMGAPLSAAYLGAHPEAPVRNLVNMAGPIDFARGGLFRTWLDAKHFDVDRFVDTLGAVPAELVRAGFKLLKPTMELSTGLNLWWNLWNERYVESFKALAKWANEYVALPGEFFRQWVREFYQDNRLYRGTLVLDGRPARLDRIRCPVLVVGAREDYIAPPACVQALVEAVASADREYVELPGGHISLIAGRSAAQHCWPAVSGWLAARSR
jgi:polyhydroxyalkanoate synthase